MKHYSYDIQLVTYGELQDIHNYALTIGLPARASKYFFEASGWFFDFVLSPQWQRQPEGLDLGQPAAFEQNDFLSLSPCQWQRQPKGLDLGQSATFEQNDLFRVKSKGNQEGLIWDNLLPLSKMSYQEESPCKSHFCMAVAQQVSRTEYSYF